MMTVGENGAVTIEEDGKRTYLIIEIEDMYY